MIVLLTDGPKKMKATMTTTIIATAAIIDFNSFLLSFIWFPPKN
jgi:hypothetical protein